MGQFSAPNYKTHDEQNDWSPNDEIDPDNQEPEDFIPGDCWCGRPQGHTLPTIINEEFPY